MTKKFVVSTADVYAYDESENLLFRGITLIDSSIESKINAVEVRGGKSNPLQFIYYTNPELSVKISDCQWSLQFLQSMVGSNVTVGNSVYVEETVVLTSGAGTVVAQPLAQPGDGSVLYGWITDSTGTVGTVVFTGKNFTYGSTSQTVCARFYATNSASQSVTISSKYIPKTVKLVMSAIIASPDVSSTVLGELQVIIPKFSLSGNYMINLKADSVSTSPVDGKALAYRDPSGTSGGCTDSDYFAKVIEIITNANWYDDVVGLSILGDDARSIVNGGATLQLSLRAVTSQGYVFTPINSGITYASSVGAKATIDANGLITSAAAGVTTISATITAKPTVGSAFILTVT